jgi:hypothetical protein
MEKLTLKEALINAKHFDSQSIDDEKYRRGLWDYATQFYNEYRDGLWLNEQVMIDDDMDDMWRDIFIDMIYNVLCEVKEGE